MIKNHTIVTKKFYLKLNRYIIRKANLLLLIIMVIVLPCTTLSCLPLIIVKGNIFHDFECALLINIFPLFIMTLLIFNFFILSRIGYKKAPHDFTYIFYNNIFVVISTDRYVKAENQINYSRIFGVTEKNDLFYIVTKDNFRFIIDKSGFEQGSANELRQLLAATTGKVSMR